MTQYLLKKNKDLVHLQYALDNYSAVLFNASIYCKNLMGAADDASKEVKENLEGKVLKFSRGKELIFSTEKQLIAIPLVEYTEGFRVEYVDEKMKRIFPHVEDPNASELIEPSFSVLRNVINDVAIDIAFEGKIKLESDGKKYWKFAKR